MQKKEKKFKIDRVKKTNSKQIYFYSISILFSKELKKKKKELQKQTLFKLNIEKRTKQQRKQAFSMQNFMRVVYKFVKKNFFYIQKIQDFLSRKFFFHYKGTLLNLQVKNFLKTVYSLNREKKGN